MSEKSPFVTIMVALQKKFNKMNEILELTKQMEETLQRNDPVSLQMVLSMRQDVMLEVDEIDYGVHQVLEVMPEELRQEVRRQMLSREAVPTESPELQKIGEISKKIKNLLDQTITIDRHLNMKIGDDSSFYAKNK